MTALFKKSVIFMVMLVALSLLLPQEAVAQEVSEKQAVHCRPRSEGQSTGTTGAINTFLAFGCRLNYRLTTWILGDTCDTQRGLCDFSREQPLCE